MKLIDMHTHTTASDGMLTPEQLVDYAIQKGLAGIAITDHDTVDGIESAIEYTHKLKDFIIIPGIELSSDYNDEEVHILGYFIDFKSNKLSQLLYSLRLEREIRAKKIIDKLNKIGIDITFDEILMVFEGASIGRPHIASILIKKGYVESIDQAFKKYLSKGGLAYVTRDKLTPKAAIDIIQSIGGFSVVAHPGLIQHQNILNDLITLGVQGIEAYHPNHSQAQTESYINIAKTHDLLVTGGSDFHYPPNDNIYNGDLGSIGIESQYIHSLLRK